MDNYDNYNNENGDDRIRPYQPHWWRDIFYMAGIVGIVVLGYVLSRL